MFNAVVVGAMLLSQHSQISVSSGLRKRADQIPLNFGAAVDSGSVNSNVDSGQYRYGITNNFNMLEPENDLKPPSLWLGVNQYNFTNSDYLINWARSNGMKVRGHVLIYANDNGYTIPGWLLAMEPQISPKQALLMLRTYISTVVGRYKGQISFWDVINEAIDDSPSGLKFNLRNSFWYRKLGPDFIYYAFQAAHAADPACHLYYNDYNIEGGGGKADNLFNLVQYLQSKGAPINGIGLQYHMDRGTAPTPGDGYYQMISRIQSKGLTFMITELDLSMNVVSYPQSDPNWGCIPSNSDDLNTQANSYAAIMNMALSFPNCEGIQLWGVTDKHSWIPWFTGGSRGAALLLDKDYLPKTAYNSVASVFAAHRHP